MLIHNVNKWPLKAILVPKKEWTQDIVNVEFHNNHDAWKGKLISNGLNRIKLSGVLVIVKKVT